MDHAGATWTKTHFGPSSPSLLGHLVSVRGHSHQAIDNAATGATGHERKSGALVPHHGATQAGVGIH